jgi:hypothetical protein
MFPLCHKRLLILALCLLSLPCGLAALSTCLQAQSAPKQGAAATPAAQFQKEIQKVFAIEERNGRLAALELLLKEHPELFQTEGAGGNVAFMIAPYIKEDAHDIPRLHVWFDRFLPVAGKAFSGSSYQNSDFDMRVARILLDNNVLLPESRDLAQKAIECYRMEDGLARQRRLHEQRVEAAKRRNEKDNEPFSESDAVNYAESELGQRYSLLGQTQAHLGDDAGASASYASALKIHPDMQAYLGQSALKERAGDKQAALRLLFEAELTGRLKANDILHMKGLYLELHPGSSEAAMNAELDAMYAQRFHNPVKFTPYELARRGSPRTVLAEFFTGAGCDPCMGPDLAFEAALERYPRRDLAVLIYHENAPYSDPLANPATKARSAYYGTHGTPHVFLDGEPVSLPEGLAIHAQESADQLFPAIDARLAAPAETRITTEASLDGGKIQVDVQVDAAAAHDDRLLQIALVERQVSYSGENSLRIQQMVVRAMGGNADSGAGFALPNNGKMNLRYTFDLAAIEAANLAYYGQIDADLKQRTHNLLSADYREKKAHVQSNRLAVVAFVQNAGTRHTEQASFVDVKTASSADQAEQAGIRE